MGVTSQAQADALVPGALTADNRADLGVDGGPGIVLPTPSATLPAALIDPVSRSGADGVANVLDGFVLRVDDFDVGETLSLNWFLTDGVNPIGVAGRGNQMGFGIFTLSRIPIGGPLPGPVFVGNIGVAGSPTEFFDTTWNVPNPALFAAEFGSQLTGAFLNPPDNIFSAPINAQVVPEPSTLLPGATLLLGVVLHSRLARTQLRRRTNATCDIDPNRSTGDGSPQREFLE